MLLVRFSISQMDVPTRQSYTMAVVEPDERSAAAGVTGIARSVGAAVAPLAAAPLIGGVALAQPAVRDRRRPEDRLRPAAVPELRRAASPRRGGRPRDGCSRALARGRRSRRRRVARSPPRCSALTVVQIRRARSRRATAARRGHVGSRSCTDRGLRRAPRSTTGMTGCVRRVQGGGSGPGAAPLRRRLPPQSRRAVRSTCQDLTTGAGRPFRSRRGLDRPLTSARNPLTGG